MPDIEDIHKSKKNREHMSLTFMWAYICLCLKLFPMHERMAYCFSQSGVMCVWYTYRETKDTQVYVHKNTHLHTYKLAWTCRHEHKTQHTGRSVREHTQHCCHPIATQNPQIRTNMQAKYGYFTIVHHMQRYSVEYAGNGCLCVCAYFRSL